jgi:hypothetical protein
VQIRAALVWWLIGLEALWGAMVIGFTERLLLMALHFEVLSTGMKRSVYATTWGSSRF